MQRRTNRIDSEVVLEHLDWVRGLARSLVRDPGLADDVSQETWLAALRGAPEDRRSLRGWLATVLRRAVLQARRREAIRREHEARSSEGDPLASPDLLERVSVQQAVVEAVLALDEPYRETILLRYFEGLSPQEIARREETPVSTVKTRLARGLALLRARLDREAGGDGRAWIAALAPLVPRSVWKGALATGSSMGGMKLGVGGVVVAVAIVLVGRWWTRPEVEPREEPVPVAALLRAPESEAAAADVPETPTAAARRSALGDAPVPAGGLRVVVVDRGSGAPVPGAEVLFGSVALFGDLDGRRKRHENVDIEEELSIRGRRARCDGDGRWTAPPEDAAFVFCARDGDRWAFGTRPEEGELVLGLEADRSLAVEVVTRDGAPARGVPVHLGGDPARPGPLDVRGVTGPEGRVEFRHLDSLLPEPSDGFPIRVSLPIASARPIRWTLDASRVPEEPVRLVLPDTGTVAVELRDDGGAPVSAWVHVTPIRVPADDPSGRSTGSRVSVRTREGRAFFPFVEVGGDVLVEADPDDRASPESKVIAGPAKPGKTVTVKLTAGKPYPVLKGRILDPDGVPLANTWVTGELVSDVDSVRGSVLWRAHTDREGGFEARAPTNRPVSSLRWLRVHTDLPPRWSAEVDLHPGPGRTVDLGDVRLVAEPVLAEGVVVDGEGEPVDWATIRVRKEVHLEGRDETYWDPVNEWMTQTDDVGAFQLLGEAPAGNFEIYAGKSRWIDADPLPLRPGSTGYRFVLEREGKLAGAVRVAEGIDPTWLGVRVEPEHRPRTARVWPPRERVSNDGTFLVAGLPAGMARVTFLLEGREDPVAVVEDVEVRAGEVSRDPRLQGLDLESALHRIEVEVVDSAGRAIDTGHVAFALADDTVHHVKLAGGRASFLAGRVGLGATIYAPGYRTVTCPVVDDGSRIVLERARTVRVRLPDDFEPPGDGIELRVAFAAESLRRRLFEEEVFSASGVSSLQWVQWRLAEAPRLEEGPGIEVPLQEEGVQCVLFALVVPAEHPRAREEVQVLEGVQPPEVSPGSELALAPDPADYGALLEWIRENRRRRREIAR